MLRGLLPWLLVGCYAPDPAEGAPCATSTECPSPLACFGGHCLAEPPPIDAAPTRDGPPAADAPLISDCPSDALQCDDFESDSLAAWTKSINAVQGTVMLIGQPVHAGRFAVDADVPQQMTSGQSAYLARQSGIPSTGMLAARAYVNAAAPLTGFAGVIQFSFGDHGEYVGVYGNTDGHWDVTEQSSAGLVDHASPIPTVSGRWVCVELDYTFAVPHFVLYVDDAVVLDLDATDPAPSFSEVGIGVTRATATGFHVFVDDVVIATGHIGC